MRQVSFFKNQKPIVNVKLPRLIAAIAETSPQDAARYVKPNNFFGRDNIRPKFTSINYTICVR